MVSNTSSGFTALQAVLILNLAMKRLLTRDIIIKFNQFGKYIKLMGILKKKINETFIVKYASIIVVHN